MDKGIGFSRTITLDWLDATATLCLEQVEYLELRERLRPYIHQQMALASETGLPPMRPGGPCWRPSCATWAPGRRR